MNRYSISLLLLILFNLLPTAQAGELGRLFFTPQQRQQLDFHDASGNSTGDSVRRNYIVVSGIVQKHGGNRTVWINGKAQTAERGNDNTPASVSVTVPGKSEAVHLKVGQRFLLEPTPPPEEDK